MRLLVMSDLHLEGGVPVLVPPGLEYDVVVLAGDIHSPGHKAVDWVKHDAAFDGKRVLLVAGNHEFYHCDMPRELDKMKRAADGSHVQVLDRDSVVIDGVRFLGCTLWTDFRLPVRQPGGLFDIDVGRALTEANRTMNDFRLIELLAPAKREYREREFRRLLRAEDTLAMHWVDRDWLRRQLSYPFHGPTVVVTHHAPATASVAERYAADWLTPAFVSDLPLDFFERPVLWIHGHTHSPFDYRRGHCRVVSNPRGYRLKDAEFENSLFDAGFVVEVPSQAVGEAQGPAEATSLSGVDEAAPRDPYVHDGLEHIDKLLLEGRRLRGQRLEAADMVSLEDAAAIAGRSTADMLDAVKRGAFLGVADGAGCLRFPKWQFEAVYAGIWKRLAKALGVTDAWVLLTTLETPLAALGGITPRTAIEQGKAERVFAILGYD